MAKKDYPLKTDVPTLLGKYRVEVSEEKDQRLSLPPMITPKVLGHGTIGGKITHVQIGVGKFKQEVLHLRHQEAGDFSFPVTKVVKSSLAAFQNVAEEKIDWQKLIGVTIAVRGLGKTKTADGKRSVNRLEIFVQKSK